MHAWLLIQTQCYFKLKVNVWSVCVCVAGYSCHCSWLLWQSSVRRFILTEWVEVSEPSGGVAVSLLRWPMRIQKYQVIGEEGSGCSSPSGKTTSCWCICVPEGVEGGWCLTGLIRWLRQTHSERDWTSGRGCVVASKLVPNVLHEFVFLTWIFKVCVWVSLSAWLLAHIHHHHHRAICVSFQSFLRSFFTTFLIIVLSWQMASYVTRATWKHNTIWPKAVQIWPASHLVTPVRTFKV